MEEMEAPTEHLHENIKEGAEHGARWMTSVALSTAVLAVLAAIASLMANHNSDEAILTQIQASDQWAYYQAKSIKSTILESGNKVLAGMGKEVVAADAAKVKSNYADQEKIRRNAEKLGEESKAHVELHKTLSKAVTIFQIAIALSAITILSRRKELWYVSLVLSLGGLYYLVSGVLW